MRPILAGLALAALLAAAPAWAGPGDEARAAARDLANKGFEHYRAGRFVDAIESFRKADKLFHAPTLVFALAKAHASAGRLIEARDLYLQVVHEKLPEGAPDEFRGAQVSAKAEVAALDARIPTLRIVLKETLGADVRVSVDDAPVAARDLGRAIERDPGTHRIIAVPAGRVGISRTVTLREGQRAVVEIDLPTIEAPHVEPPVVAPRPAPAIRPVPAPAPPPPRPAPPRKGSLLPAFISFGVGAVGVGLGVAMGVDTLGRKSEITGSKSCAPRGDGFVCGADQQEKLDAARSSATLSTVGFVIGGVGAAAGITLLVLRPGGGPAKASVRFGPGSLAVAGVFR